MTIESAGTSPAQPVGPAPTAAKLNSFQRIVGVFFTPTETFEDIARKPDFLVPIIILVLITFVSTIVVIPHLDFDAVVAQQTEMMKKQNPNMTDADMERVGRMTRTFGKMAGYVSPLLILIGLLVIAVVLWGAVRLMGGQGDFGQALSTTIYAWFPRMLLGGIIGMVIVMMRGMVDPTQMAAVVKTSPAFLVDMKEQPILFALLSSLDIFVIWTCILLTIGFSVLSKLSRAKTATIIFSLWFVTILFKVGMAAITAARMKG